MCRMILSSLPRAIYFDWWGFAHPARPVIIARLGSLWQRPTHARLVLRYARAVRPWPPPRPVEKTTVPPGARRRRHRLQPLRRGGRVRRTVIPHVPIRAAQRVFGPAVVGVDSAD